MNGWISIKDKLPEVNRDVLVYKGGFIGDLMNVYCYLGDDRWEDEYGYFDTAESEGITHWMPLPEPPKTESVDTGTDEIKPCPFCGHIADIHTTTTDFYIGKDIVRKEKKYAVMCCFCSAMTRHYPFKGTAIKAWNKRVAE